MNACVHIYTKPQTSSTRRRGPGWRIHVSVEDTKLSTDKQHSLSFRPAPGLSRLPPPSLSISRIPNTAPLRLEVGVGTFSPYVWTGEFIDKQQMNGDR